MFPSVDMFICRCLSLKLASMNFSNSITKLKLFKKCHE